MKQGKELSLAEHAETRRKAIVSEGEKNSAVSNESRSVRDEWARGNNNSIVFDNTEE
jgi:hypothetical protein